MSDELQGIGWSRVGDKEDRGRAMLTIAPGDDGCALVGICIEPYENAPGPMIETRITLEPGKLPRKLRRLATFSREQARFGPEMDVEDEMRAMSAIVRTVEALPADARRRVLAWVAGRTLAPEGTIASVDESLRAARQRMGVSTERP